MKKLTALLAILTVLTLPVFTVRAGTDTCDSASETMLSDGHGCQYSAEFGPSVRCFSGYQPNGAQTDCVPVSTTGASPGGGDQSFNTIIGPITPPSFLTGLTSKGGAGGLSTVLSNLIQLIFTISAIAVVFMVLLGAFQWITSGGDKEHVAKARSRITNAIIGLILLALAFFILRILGNILHFTFFT